MRVRDSLSFPTGIKRDTVDHMSAVAVYGGVITFTVLMLTADLRRFRRRVLA